MGTGWRRAFCTSTLPRNSDVEADLTGDQVTASPSPRSCTKLGFFSHSNPSTPRLRCRTSAAAPPPPSEPPDTRPKAAAQNKVAIKSPRSSDSTSPLKLSLFRNSFRSRSNCGVCAQSVKTGQGTAIYTAECGHAFHFPCIAAHVTKEGSLACPVCEVSWKDAPLLAVRPHAKISTPKTEKKMTTKDESPRQLYHLKPVSVIRAYDDDESLLTPTAGGKFNPIPEADEEHGEEAEEEEEVEEFQGFFVNPIPSCSLKPSNSWRNVEVKPMPEAAILSVNHTHETYAIALRVKAPSTPLQTDQCRRRAAPIDLVAVLDVSGSMGGSKLHMLKRAMRLVISSLGASDRLSIVAFSATTKRLLPLRRMTLQGQLSAKHIVDRLTCGQGSNAGDALKKAAKVLEDRREKNPVASILLLSDGQDQTQLRRERSHVSSGTRISHIEIPVHDSGYGKSCGYSLDAAEDTFAKHVGCLLSVVVQDLRIKLKLDINGADISAVYCNNFRPTLLGSDSIRLGDLYAEEERELLLEVRVAASVSGTRPVITARCNYRDPTTLGTVNCREQSFLIPKLVPIRSRATKTERLRNLFIATRAIAEARGLVEQCEFSKAECLLASARALVLQSSTSEMSAGEYVRGLEIEMMELARRQQLMKQTAAQSRRRKQEEWGEFGLVDENGDPLTPTSAWRAAEMLAKVAMMKKSLNKVNDLHGFENARF